jgi:hypothetical protein
MPLFNDIGPLSKYHAFFSEIPFCHQIHFGFSHSRTRNSAGKLLGSHHEAYLKVKMIGRSIKKNLCQRNARDRAWCAKQRIGHRETNAESNNGNLWFSISGCKSGGVY